MYFVSVHHSVTYFRVRILLVEDISYLSNGKVNTPDVRMVVDVYFNLPIGYVPGKVLLWGSPVPILPPPLPVVSLAKIHPHGKICIRIHNFELIV